MKIEQGLDVSVEELIGLSQQAKRLNLYSKKRSRSLSLGGHLSAMRGRGIEFDEVRAYQAGDDIRQMDWRVTARSGRPHIKLYHEDRERPVYFVMDFNPSMYFATRVAFKSVIACYIAATLAWRALFDGDRVGGFLFNGDCHEEFLARSHQKSVLHLLKLLSQYSQSKAQLSSPLSKVLSRISRVLNPGALVFIISDFHGLDEDCHRYLSRLRKHHELFAIEVRDPIEVKPPPPSRYAISDGRRSSILNLNSSKVRMKYLEFFDSIHGRFEEMCSQYNIPSASIATNDDWLYKLNYALSLYQRGGL